jgi:RNA polymerase sigma factor for flagellar operon FliA
MIASPTPRSRGTRPAQRARSVLLTQHLGLVHHVARQLARRLSTAADLDEMVSAGMVGLIQAADTFDVSRGLSFSTYAVPRIRGAILDELRRQDALPRNVRRRTRDLGRAREVLAATLRRQPTHDEVAHVMNVPADTIRKWELDAEGAAICSLDQPLRSEEAGVTLADTMAAEDARGVEDLLTHEAEVERLRAAIAGLKEQERTVLALNFFEELKLHEIAEVLRLSVCRISQIRTAALAKLRVSLSELRAA